MEMIKNGDHEEAKFCQLIRNWYSAEDDPGISAYDRTMYRLELRQWLMSKYNAKHYPTPGLHVSGIPVVLFKGLLNSCERKIQIYSFVRENAYNTRTISSLDAENFFSDFQELDPRGNGVIRPEDIPKAIGTACGIIQARMDPNRSFSIRTSTAPVYPVQDVQFVFQDVQMQGNDDDVPLDNMVNLSSILISINQLFYQIKERKPKCVYDREMLHENYSTNHLFPYISVLFVIAFLVITSPSSLDEDHIFDTVSRRRRKPKRGKGDVNRHEMPARGVTGVRQHHKRDESKILPHIRLGIDIH